MFLKSRSSALDLLVVRTAAVDYYKPVSGNRDRLAEK